MRRAVPALLPGTPKSPPQKSTSFSDREAWEKELGWGMGEPSPAHVQGCLTVCVCAARLLRSPPGSRGPLGRPGPSAGRRSGWLPPPLPAGHWQGQGAHGPHRVRAYQGVRLRSQS